LELKLRLRAGDSFLVRISSSSERKSAVTKSEIRLLVRVRTLNPDGSAQASLELEGSPEGSRKLPEQPIEVVVFPTGYWRPADGSQPAHGLGPALPVSFVGLPLPGKAVVQDEKWSFKVAVGHDEQIGVTAQAAAKGSRVVISGASSPKDEAKHMIRATVEGVFLPSEGYVSESRIELDYSALVEGTKTKFVYQTIRQ
jgi:hypothetical protein